MFSNISNKRRNGVLRPTKTNLISTQCEICNRQGIYECMICKKILCCVDTKKETNCYCFKCYMDKDNKHFVNAFEKRNSYMGIMGLFKRIRLYFKGKNKKTVKPLNVNKIGPQY
jgi:hypothetical protein